jgi:outer membrane protein assembly factor BamE (lipoprotein component of BamABCDE complex)
MKTIGIAVAIFIAVIAGLVVARSYSPIDGFSSIILSLVFPEDTIYASGYTDAGFMKIEVGMTRDQVYQILGKPLSVWTNDTTVGERWSRSPGDTHFRCRVLQFLDEKVVDKHSEYYVD